jgi:hypothetical protein
MILLQKYNAGKSGRYFDSESGAGAARFGSVDPVAAISHTLSVNLI